VNQVQGSWSEERGDPGSELGVRGEMKTWFRMGGERRTRFRFRSWKRGIKRIRWRVANQVQN
jgi:hypothetical protein